MKIKNKKASVFVYVLILINVALIIGYVVFNNTYILNNNINIWKNAEEVFLKLSDKANINIESVRQYNRNGGWFSDNISCPQNITMSWTIDTQSWITSEMNYDFGTVYCIFYYLWEPWRIYFDEDTQKFTSVYFKWELRDIINNAFNQGWEIANNTISWVWNEVSSAYQPAKSLDASTATEYKSKKEDYGSITYDLWSEKKLSKIIIEKKTKWPTFWNNGTMYLKNGWNTILKTITLPWMNDVDLVEKTLDYWSYASADGIRYIQIKSDQLDVFLNVAEISIYELTETWEIWWEAESTFNDTDQTFFSFDSTGIGWEDWVDDNMNSDNYRSSSTWALWYPWDYLDDDITPRTTIFWNVSPNTSDYFNIFWNNYITNNLINANVYNNDDPLRVAKIGEVVRWYLFFDLFSKTELPLSYNLKIIEFDRNAYEKEYTLLPTAIYETLNLSDNYWYLQLDWDNMSFSRYKTWKEFEFDFKNKDYSIYVTNNLETNMAIRITWEEKPTSWDPLTTYWRQIYINPIDDSKPWVIETIANHIIIGWEKNFIWENFKVIWAK